MKKYFNLTDLVQKKKKIKKRMTGSRYFKLSALLLNLG